MGLLLGILIGCIITGISLTNKLSIKAYGGTSHIGVEDIFEAGFQISYESYSNWASSINNTRPFLVIHPRSSQEVVTIVNWAFATGKNVRVKGFRHSYPPITVSEKDDPGQVVLVDMKRHMNRLKLSRATIPIENGSNQTNELTTVIAETGASMEQFMKYAEEKGYGIENAPIVGGDATVGGVLAIGGHGAGVPAINEKLSGPGFSFGSVSNLVVQLKAVVWDEKARRYVLRTFHRSDPDIAPFLVHIGRAVVTEVSLLVGQNYNMRCLSIVDVPGEELFARPTTYNTNLRTMSSFIDQYGRADAIWFPFTKNPWLKIWEVTNDKPQSSRFVDRPYNYQFSYTFDNPQNPGTVFGPDTYDRLVEGLTRDDVWDIWGPSKNTILYYNRTATPLSYSGFVVLTNRNNIQTVLADIAEFYLQLLDKYRIAGEFPIDQYIKLRVTGLDNPRETLILGAVAPDISPTSPSSTRPDFNVGVWMNTLTTTDRPFSDQFMREFEQWAYQRFNGEDAQVRPEWSKNWGHSNKSPFSDREFIEDIIPKSFGLEAWNHAIQVLNKYDPHYVISNRFLRTLMVPTNQKEKKYRGVSHHINAEQMNYNGWTK